MVESKKSMMFIDISSDFKTQVICMKAVKSLVPNYFKSQTVYRKPVKNWSVAIMYVHCLL